MFGIEQRWQLFVYNLDQLGGAPGGQFVLGGDRRDGLADIADLAAGQHRLVVDKNAEAVFTGDIVACHDTFYPGKGFGSANVDRNDGGVRLRAAQHRHVQHARHDHVAGIFELAGDLAGCIDTADAIADIGGAGIAAVEGGERLGAGDDVAGQFDCIENLLVAGAAADVTAEAFADLVAAGVRIGAQRRGGGHDHAGYAIAALAGAGLDEGALEDGRQRTLGQAFDGLDRGAVDLGGGHQAGLDQTAVDEHRTGAAFARAAAFLGAGQVQLVAQQIDETQMGSDGQMPRAAVEGEGNLAVRHRSAPERRCGCRNLPTRRSAHVQRSRRRHRDDSPGGCARRPGRATAGWLPQWFRQ